MKKWIAVSFILGLFSCGSNEPLPTVDSVSLEEYSGLWYEIARLPNSFQSNCTCTTAEYTIRDGYVEVFNRCWDSQKEEFNEIKGKAFPVEGSENASLKVQFFWPFKGDYNIIALDDDYQYALVGPKSRKYLWVLSRNPVLAQNIFDQIVAQAKTLGYPVDQLLFTEHPCPK